MKKQTHPCQDCITYSICKAIMSEKYTPLYTLICKCKILNEYLEPKDKKYILFDRHRYNASLELFNVINSDDYYYEMYREEENLK